MPEVTQSELEAAEVALAEARFQFHRLIVETPALHLAHSRMQAAEQRAIEARRARREAELFE